MTTARTLSALTFGLAATFLAPPSATPDAPADFAAIDAYLHERMSATGTPGMAYAIVSTESVEHVGVRGEAGDGQPISADTPFLWGSVSKPVTATAVMSLVEQGHLGLDEPVVSYLPEFTLADDEAAGSVTVQDLLRHTSGIPAGTGATDRFAPTDDPYGDAIAVLADVAPLSDPGERYSYASENYLLLGALVAAVADEPFEEYLAAQVLAPLGMDSAITTRAAAETRLPAGHGYAFGRPVSLPGHFDPTGPSYGYLGGSVNDLASFAIAHLNGGSAGTARVLEPDSVELMRADTVRVNDTIGYGAGWRVDSRNEDLGTSTAWHSGAVHGYQATLVLFPELERGIVVLQNIYGVFQDWDLVATGLHAGRILAGGEPESVAADPTYPVVLGALFAVLAATIAATAASIIRAVRRKQVRRRRAFLIGTACWSLGALALAYGVGVLLPEAFGASLPLIRLWAPDAGWLATAVVAGALLLAVTRPVTAAVRLRGLRARQAPSDGSTRRLSPAAG